jgi:hypothetical protein
LALGFSSSFLGRNWFEQPQNSRFVNGNVVGFVASDEILWFILCGMMDVTFDPDVRSDFSDDDAANSACLRIP